MYGQDVAVNRYYVGMKARFHAALRQPVLPPELLHIVALTQEVCAIHRRALFYIILTRWLVGLPYPLAGYDSIQASIRH